MRNDNVTFKHKNCSKIMHYSMEFVSSKASLQLLFLNNNYNIKEFLCNYPFNQLSSFKNVFESTFVGQSLGLSSLYALIL